MSIFTHDTDKNLYSIVGGEQQDKYDDNVVLNGGDQYDDILKLSNCSNLKLKGWKISGGSEDCVDINRGQNIELIDFELDPINNGLTVKGGAQNVIGNFFIKNNGQKTDIIVGQYSDQSKERVKQFYVSAKKSDMSKVIIELWDSDDVIIFGGGPYKIKRINPLLVKIWFFIRRYILKLFYKLIAKIKS